MIIGAHPDDPDFFCGGTVARWTEAGTIVRYVVVTSGDKGAPAPSDDPIAFSRRREAEQEASARHLGVQGVTFLRLPDGEVFDSAALHAAFPSVRLETFFPRQALEGLKPHVVRGALLFASDRPDTFVDIAPVFERKIAALELHASQASAFPGGPRARLRRRAEEAGPAAGLRLAEAFLYVDLE